MRMYVVQVQIIADTDASQGDVAVFVENAVRSAADGLLSGGRKLFPQKTADVKHVGVHTTVTNDDTEETQA